MAIQGYIGWASFVNRIILEATSITIGENATRQDDTSSGVKRSVLKGLFNPDKYSVIMEFNWERIDERTGLTELQMFYEWYKYQHRYGTVPFEFPQILYSPQTGITGIDVKNSQGARRLITNKTEFYKITSAVEGSRRGSDVQVRMTWENVYGGEISIPDPVQEITTISVSGVYGFVEVVFKEIGNTIPVSSNFKIYIDDNLTNSTGFMYDNGYKCRLYFDMSNIENEVSHLLTISYQTASYSLPKDKLKAYFVKGSDQIYYTQSV